MATGMKTFKYGIDFNVNKQSLNTVKTELLDLKGEIESLYKNVTFTGSKKSLDELKDTVSKLQNYIDQAWNNKLGQLNLNTLNQSITNS